MQRVDVGGLVAGATGACDGRLDVDVSVCVVWQVCDLQVSPSGGMDRKHYGAQESNFL